MGKDRFEDLDFIDFNDNRRQEGTVIADMLSAVYRNRKWFILSVAVCVLIGFLYLKSSPKIFLRTATVLVKDEQKGGGVNGAAAFQDLFSLGGSTVDNEVGIFKSKRLMRTVVETLHLDISYKEWDGLRKKELYTSTPFAVTFLDATPSQQISLTVTMSDNGKVTLADMTLQNEEEEEEFDEILTVQPGDTVNTPVGKMVVASTLFTDENSIGKTVYVTKGNMKEVAESYNKALNVGVANKQSSLIALSIEDENVQRAEDLLNTLIEVYKNDAIEDKNRIVINTARFIGERLEIIEADLAAVDAEIENYKKKNRLTDIASESALYLQSSSMLDTEGLSVENQLNMAQYMKEYLQDNSKTTEPVPASIGIDDMGVQNLIMEYNTVLTRRNKLIANSSANNPLVRDLNGTLMSMRLSIAKAVDNLIASLEIQVANMKNKERENSNKIAFVPTQLKYVVSIERQQKIKEELYLFLLNKKEENELQLSITESNCRIIDPAEGVDLPVAPKKAQVALIALLAGLSVENQLNMAQYMKEYLQDNSKTTEPVPASIGIDDMGVQNLIMEYNTVLTRRNKLIANSSANNPLVRDLNGTLMSMRLSIAKAVDNLIASLEIQVANMKNKERENSNKIAFVPTQLKYVVSIERQQKIKEELYLFLLNKKEENELQLSITESNCRIIDPAEGVDLPVAPKKAQVALIALLAGIMLPALWIYIRSLLNTSVHTKKELKAGVNIPFLGEVPLEKNKHEKDIVVQEGSRESICEAFKIVRDNLDFMDTEKKTVGKVVLVTSANPDSGKTFITLNLGMSMALANVKVVILDLDLRKGSLSKSVGIGMKKTGVSNYLSGKVDDVKELVQVCGDDNRLHIITSGALPPNPAELLKSGRLDRLLEELKKNYDYILLDNPPYGVVVDTQLCGQLADQTVYVVRSGLFDKRMLPELQELYDSGKMKNMSILLNGIDYVKTGYGYGYGYGYGNYGNDENRKNKKPLYKRIFGI